MGDWSDKSYTSKKKVIDLSTKEGEAYLRKHNPGLTAESRDLPPWTIIPKKTKEKINGIYRRSRRTYN